MYKKRVRNIDLPKGKSSGFRVIGYKDIEMGKFYLLSIYSKSEKETIHNKEVIELLKGIGVFSWILILIVNQPNLEIGN